MQTRIVKINDPSAQREEIEKAGELIRRGELVAFPTETVYGLGANGFDATACAKIYAAKGRPSDNPLILHVADRAMIDLVAAEVNDTAEKLLTAFCPGALTLILPKSGRVPPKVTGNLSTVGVRWPDNAVARALIAAAGVPIAAPSANISGRPSPTTAEMTVADMTGKIPLILDGGNTRVGVESTIVDCSARVATILRPGGITREMLAEVLGEVRLDPGLERADAAPKAPGMKYRHYAPKAPLTVFCGKSERMEDFFLGQAQKLQNAGKRAGILASREVADAVRRILPSERVFAYGTQGNLTEIARNLYAGLCYFDNCAVDLILAEGVTETNLGLAIMNRLQKASGGRVIEIGEFKNDSISQTL